MSERDGIGVRPLTAGLWEDAATVFGSRGDPSRCWCQYFRLTGRDWREADARGNREALQRQSREDPFPGLLAYDGTEPVGWIALAPRTAYPRLVANARLRSVVGAEVLEDEATWAITCFVVRPSHRRKGVAAALLAAVPDFARENGARRLEAQPVDVDARSTVSSDELYHGVLSTFLDAGYREIGRTGPSRPVVRLDLG